jgi:predicted nucleic acid-binding protein
VKHIVLDASVALALLLNEEHPYAERILEEYLSAECVAHVPYIWHMEIRNILLLKERKGVFAP